MSILAQFVTKDQQAKLPAYWARMFCLGTLGDRVSTFRVCFRDGVSHNRHKHPQHDEIVVVTAGAIDQTIGDQTKTLVVGEAAIIPRGMAHKATPIAGNTEVVVILYGEGTRYETVELGEPPAIGPSDATQG